MLYDMIYKYLMCAKNDGLNYYYYYYPLLCQEPAKQYKHTQ